MDVEQDPESIIARQDSRHEPELRRGELVRIVTEISSPCPGRDEEGRPK